MPDVKWAIRGEYMESCNCDYLCPCIYTNPQGPVTYDNCYAVLVFRIDDGDFDGTRLDGCKFAFVLRSGKVRPSWAFPITRSGSISSCEERKRGPTEIRERPLGGPCCPSKESYTAPRASSRGTLRPSRKRRPFLCARVMRSRRAVLWRDHVGKWSE